MTLWSSLEFAPLTGFDAAGELIAAVQHLSLARSLADVQMVVRCAARRLTGADGATFVLRDEDHCFYADEDAIEPLWKVSGFRWMSASADGRSLPPNVSTCGHMLRPERQFLTAAGPPYFAPRVRSC